MTNHKRYHKTRKYYDNKHGHTIEKTNTISDIESAKQTAIYEREVALLKCSQETFVLMVKRAQQLGYMRLCHALITYAEMREKTIQTFLDSPEGVVS